MLVEAGDINAVEVGLERFFIVFKAPHSLHYVEAQVVVDLNIKMVNLVQKDRKIFVEAFGKKNSSIE